MVRADEEADKSETMFVFFKILVRIRILSLTSGLRTTMVVFRNVFFNIVL
jgi:hypothetical protein